ncbi:hypothetical protein J6590_000752 [Homalodisca vitripennis]|nr:hypothetical protein J6590_000752 [Homalodisca vitripennis]
MVRQMVSICNPCANTHHDMVEDHDIKVSDAWGCLKVPFSDYKTSDLVQQEGNFAKLVIFNNDYHGCLRTFEN